MFRWALGLAATVLTTTVAMTTVADEPASANEPSASVRVDVGPPEPFPKRLFGFNTNLLTATAFQSVTYDSDPVQQAVRDLRPTMLRFPGGTIANNYRWEKDSFSSPENDKTQWAAEQLRLFRKIGRPYGMPNFAKLCSEREAEPIWVLNVYEETPESVVKLLRRFDELDLDVRRIELGNEPYWDGRSLMNVWRYMQYARPLAKEIAMDRPDIQIGICFGDVSEDKAYRDNWNAKLLGQSAEDRRWYDAIVYHEYFGGQGIAVETGQPLTADVMTRPEAMFRGPADRIQSVAPEKTVWFTEWNAGQDALDQWRGTVAERIFLASSFAALIEQRDVINLACFHEIYGAKFGAFFVDKSDGMTKTSTWPLFEMLGAVVRSSETLRPLSLDDPNHDVVGFAGDGSNGMRLFVTNRSANVVDLKLSDPMAKTFVRRHTLSGPLRSSVADQTTIPPAVESEAQLFRLPPFSINLLTSGTPIDFGSSRPVAVRVLPRRPHLTLWFPPYAKNQPRIDPSGRYEIDLDAIRDKPMAMIKMDVRSLDLHPGHRYRFTFAMQNTGRGGVVMKLPADVEPQFQPTTATYQRHEFTFDYDPSRNDNEIQFFFSGDSLVKGGKLTLKDFDLSELPSHR